MLLTYFLILNNEMNAIRLLKIVAKQKSLIIYIGSCSLCPINDLLNINIINLKFS